jgi:predicted permease
VVAYVRRFVLRLSNILRPHRAELELARELESHMVLLEDECRRRGMTPEQARLAARRTLGGLEHTKQLHRDARSFVWLDDARRDLHYTMRTLRRTPGFTAIAVLTLALGVGANTAIFSAVNAILIRQLPYTDPDRVVMIWEDATAAGFPRNTPAPGNYTEWTRLQRAFTGIAATISASASLTDDGVPEQVIGRGVTSNFFQVLGVEPLMGRTFTDPEDRAGASVVVISYGLWQRRYGGDASMLGKTLLLNDRRYDVIGVMPRPFIFRRGDVDYWVPTHFTAAVAAERRSHYLNVVARLKPDVTLEAADADMRRVSDTLQQTYPDTNARLSTMVVPVKEDLLGNTRVELLVLMGAAAAVLLIACANLASLLLSRAASRRGELAVRTALGATRGRLVRQMVMEAMTLSIAGGAMGLVIAPAGVSLMAQLAPRGFPPIPVSALDLRLLAFTLILAVSAGLVFSLVPAWQATGASWHGAPQQGARSTVGGQRRQTREGLVVLQVGAALVLLVAAGLMLRTLANLRAVDLGFRPDHLLTLRTTLPQPKYSQPAQRLAFYDRVVTGIRTLPGVVRAAYGSTLPFASSGNTLWYQIDGVTLDPDDPADTLNRVGTSDYLRTLGVRLVEGRLLDERDGAGAPPAIVVNETMARRYWPHDEAIGHRIRFAPSAPLFTIVGVVKDVRERGYEWAMKPGVYFSVAQRADWSLDSLVVRVNGEPAGVAKAIRQIIADVDPTQPVAAVRAMDEIVEQDVADRRQQMMLLAVFAGLALLLASIGLYGVLSYAVAQRTREFGLRIALGASPGSVMRMVVVRGASLMAVGLAMGLALAWAGARVMNRLLYGVTAGDPVTFAAVVALLGSIGLVACYVPARRATRIDAMEALRHE